MGVSLCLLTSQTQRVPTKCPNSAPRNKSGDRLPLVPLTVYEGFATSQDCACPRELPQIQLFSLSEAEKEILMEAARIVCSSL